MANNKTPIEQKKKISPFERAQRFAQLTRKHWQPLAPVAATENSTVQFTLTKSRLLSKIFLLVKGTMTLTHAASTAGTLAPFAPYSFVKNVRVEYNNGFSPFNIPGKELYMYNLARGNGASIKPATSVTAATAAAMRERNVVGLQSGAGGVANTFRFLAELPIAVNDRDPVSLFLLQNEEVTVTVTVEFDDADVVLSTLTGFTVAMSSLSVTPVIETFSIPPVAEAFPDLGMIKLVNRQKEAISGAGDFTTKLRVGNIYRKLFVLIEDAAGGEFDGDLSGNFELVFNEADYPVRIPPWVLSGLNHEWYGTTLPQGVWVFDFTYQGIPNYGGGRDYVDTEKMTEFWFKFTAAAAGNITVLHETLTRLRSS